MQLERQMLVVKDDSLDDGCLTILWRLLYIGML